MDYYEDMTSKFGFSDGETVPPDASERREIYIRAINKIAAALGSKQRMVAWDRGGIHNWCLITPLLVDDLIQVGCNLDLLHDPVHIGLSYDRLVKLSPPEEDEAMQQAIITANGANLDQYVETVVTINPAFEKHLAIVGRKVALREHDIRRGTYISPDQLEELASGHAFSAPAYIFAPSNKVTVEAFLDDVETGETRLIIFTDDTIILDTVVEMAVEEYGLIWDVSSAGNLAKE